MPFGPRQALLCAACILAGCRPQVSGPDSRHAPDSRAPDDSAGDTGPAPFLEGGEPFTVALLPDTQLYAQDHPEIFLAQTQWILDNHDAEDIAFVLHEGDITNANSSTQWANATAAMQVLDGEVPYVMAVGNHDTGSGGSASTRETSLFNESFPLDRFHDEPWFGGVFESERMDNVYALFEAGGVPWLVFGLEFGPRDDVLDWAHAVALEHPDHQVMVVSHAHVYSDDSLHGSLSSHSWNPHAYGLDQQDGDVNDGVEVWEALQDLPNLAFTFNGHILNDGAGRVTGTGTHGNQVHQLLANYQMLDNGGDGWMRLMRFEPGSRRVDVQTFSPTLGRDNTARQHDFAIHDLAYFSAVDGDGPTLEQLSWLGGLDRLAVVFDESVDDDLATDPARYTLDGGATVRSATLGSDGRTVELGVEGMQAETAYELVVEQIRDDSVNNNRSSGLSWAFTPQTSFVEDFEDSGLGDWKVVQDGATDGPAWWEVEDGSLVQRANVYDGDAGATSERSGTHVYLDDPLALEWSDFTFTAELRSEDNDGIGLLFRYQEDGSCYKLELDSQRSFRKLLRIQDGEETVVASSSEGYAQGETMQIELSAQGETIQVSIDGEIQFGGALQDDGPSSGTVGLYCWGNEGCWFDDVVVEGFAG